MLKRLILIIVFIVFAGAFVLAGSFFLIPKDRLNAIIASQLSEAFGYDIILSGNPSVHIFPYLSVSFGPLQVINEEGADKPLANIERANGRLSVTSLWEGKPALRYIELEKADISLIKQKDGQTNWSAARFFTEENQGEKRALRFPSRLRLVRFKNTNLTFIDDELGKEQKFQNINVDIKGPPRNADFSINGRFSWHGDEIAVNLALAEPAAFINGATSKAVFDVSGKWIKARFNGEMGWDAPFRAEGNIEAELPNPSAFARWLNLNGADLLIKDKVSLVGDGIFSKSEIDFRPIGIRFNNSRGDGRLVVNFANKNVDLSGTLAFDQVALNDTEKEDHSYFIKKLLQASDFKSNLDLRISSDKGQIGHQEFDNLALGVVAGKDTFLLNIGAVSLIDAQGVVEGHLNGEIAVRKQGDKKQAEANLTLRQTQLDTVDKLFNINLPIDGTSDVVFEAKADARDDNLFAETAELVVRANFKQSTFYGIRFDEVVHISDKQEPSQYNNASYQTSFDKGSFEAFVNALGIVEVSNLQLENTDYNLFVSGRVDLNEDKVSAKGKLSFSDEENKELFLTFGGALSSPIISEIDDKKTN